MKTETSDYFPATLKQKQSIVRMLEKRGGNTDGILSADMTTSKAHHFIWALYRESRGRKTELTEK